MTSARHLPSVQQILDNALAEMDRARDAFSEAQSWLRSDWRPDDTPTPEQAAARTAMRKCAAACQAAIDAAKRVYSDTQRKGT